MDLGILVGTTLLAGFSSTPASDLYDIDTRRLPNFGKKNTFHLQSRFPEAPHP